MKFRKSLILKNVPVYNIFFKLREMFHCVSYMFVYATLLKTGSLDNAIQDFLLA